MADKAETWLKRKLGYVFHDPDLLRQALTHRSVTGGNNERLEFLGDAVLDLVITEFLIRSHARASEGDLSRLRASLVNDSSLADLASDLGLGEHLLLGGGERKAGGHRRDSINADALEAIFGAVYLDGGYEASQRLIERAFGERLVDLPDADDLRDPKTRLQEWLQARGFGLPVYDLIEVSGAAHRQQFKVSCLAEESGVATEGVGSTRRYAEQQAAERMLTLLTDDAPS